MKEGRIKEVYIDNFEAEIFLISKLIETYNFVSLDTEFPGFLHESIKQTGSNSFSEYSVIRKNVEDLKLIQVGLTICDRDGNFPEECSTWQFNMQFDKK